MILLFERRTAYHIYSHRLEHHKAYPITLHRSTIFRLTSIIIMLHPECEILFIYLLIMSKQTVVA